MDYSTIAKISAVFLCRGLCLVLPFVAVVSVQRKRCSFCLFNRRCQLAVNRDRSIQLRNWGHVLGTPLSLVLQPHSNCFLKNHEPTIQQLCLYQKHKALLLRVKQRSPIVRYGITSAERQKVMHKHAELTVPGISLTSGSKMESTLLQVTMAPELSFLSLVNELRSAPQIV